MNDSFFPSIRLIIPINLPTLLCSSNSGFANPDGVTFEMNGHCCEADVDPFDKLKHHDIYDKNSNFNKHKEEFKQQINFTGTLYRYFLLTYLFLTLFVFGLNLPSKLYLLYFSPQ